MKYRYLIYTTARSSWYEKEATKAARFLEQTPGRDEVEFVFEHIDIKNAETINSGKSTSIDWDWFRSQFPKKEYDGVGFHFTPFYQRKWGLTFNGHRNRDNKDYPEFWLRADRRPAEGYDFSELVRLLVHEVGHFDEDVDDSVGNRISQDFVHIMDYELKAIHHFPRMVDYRGITLKKLLSLLFKRIKKQFYAIMATSDK